MYSDTIVKASVKTTKRGRTVIHRIFTSSGKKIHVHARLKKGTPPSQVSFATRTAKRGKTVEVKNLNTVFWGGGTVTVG